MGTAVNLEWAFASRPIEGQLRCGDACTVKPFPGGALVAAVDGLGHGDAAADASELCVKVLEEQPGAPVDQQLLKCHERLKATRGVVMSLVRFDHARAELTWAGIGNVEAVLVRNGPMVKKRRESLMVFGGVVGGQLAGVRTSSLSLSRGDLLMLATDGLRPDFTHELEPFGECKAIAQKSLLKWGKGNDDALVVVARWLGTGEAAAR